MIITAGLLVMWCDFPPVAALAIKIGPLLRQSRMGGKSLFLARKGFGKAFQGPIFFLGHTRRSTRLLWTWLTQTA